MSFQVLSDLPVQDQREYERISAIPSGQRTAGEQAFLNARSSYADNTIIEKDASGNILRASGPEVPDVQEGFAKGAFFIEIDVEDGNGAVYQNIGDEESCSFEQLGVPVIPQGTPTNVGEQTPGSIGKCMVDDGFLYVAIPSEESPSGFYWASTGLTVFDLG